MNKDSLMKRYWATPLTILDTTKRGDSGVAEVVRLRMRREKDRILTNSATKIVNGIGYWGWILCGCLLAAIGCGGSSPATKTTAKKPSAATSPKKPTPPPPKPKPKVVVSQDAYADVSGALQAYRSALNSNNGDEADKVEAWLELTKDQSVPALAELLKDPDTAPEVQSDASRALGRCGPTAAPALLEVIASAKVNQVRIKAIESVSILKPSNPTIVKALQNLMKDQARDSQTRQHAILGLQRIGPPAKDVVRDLMNILNNTKENDTVRSAAKAALKDIDPRKGFHGMKLE